jgi:hypothetical protein
VPCQLGHRCLSKSGAIHTLDQPIFILLARSECQNAAWNKRKETPDQDWRKVLLELSALLDGAMRFIAPAI